MLVLAVSAFAQPTITAIENNYSYLPAGLPNSAIAQGAIFIVKGTNLGPPTLVSSTFPLQTSFQNVSATVTVDTNTSVNLPIYYAWAQQLAFVLPSSTPVGTGTLSITVNGQTVNSPITVVSSQFGLLNLNAQGSGPAAAEHIDFSFTTPNSAANPGEEVVLWGSGLGASTGSDTDVVAPGETPGTLTGTTPVQVWIGGLSAQVVYAGRSIYPGLDQVNVYVPSTVSPGCFVSVYVNVGSGISNVATIPVAPAGTRTCSDPNGISADDIQMFYSKPDFKLGDVYLSRFQPSLQIFPPPVKPVPVALDHAGASFADYTPVQGWQSQSKFHIPSLGSCTVNTFQGDATNAVPVDPIMGTGLDAGLLKIAGPAGSQTIPKVATGYYSVNLSGNTTANPVGTPYLNPGNYTLTATGGADVSFSPLMWTIAAPTITWNLSSTTIPRASDFTLNWTKADPNSTVVIVGISTNANQIGAAFACAASPGASGSGSFTVPAGIMGGLPPSTPATGTGFVLPPGFLFVGTTTTTRFTATGLDAGYLTNASLNGQVVTFQ
jgi:uncharacterized protein (TIGR03437 family)